MKASVTTNSSRITCISFEPPDVKEALIRYYNQLCEDRGHYPLPTTTEAFFQVELNGFCSAMDDAELMEATLTYKDCPEAQEEELEF